VPGNAVTLVQYVERSGQHLRLGVTLADFNGEAYANLGLNNTQHEIVDMRRLNGMEGVAYLEALTGTWDHLIDTSTAAQHTVRLCWYSIHEREVRTRALALSGTMSEAVLSLAKLAVHAWERNVYRTLDFPAPSASDLRCNTDGNFNRYAPQRLQFATKDEFIKAAQRYERVWLHRCWK